MRVLYEKSQGVKIQFSPSELNIALLVLKAIYRGTDAEFIKDVIDDIEEDLKPKPLPMINYWHCCVKCTRSIDEREENTMRITRDGDTLWQCRVCEPFKQNRP